MELKQNLRNVESPIKSARHLIWWWRNMAPNQHVPTDQAAPELHRLKIDAQPMSDLLSGNKTCEVRNDDRGFTVGDYVHLVCADGRETDRIISHIQRGYGLPDGLCVLSYRADLAAPSAPAEVEGLVDRAGTEFADYFRNNYPGPDTIIHDPEWHAPKLFRAATHQFATALTALQSENERLRTSGIAEIAALNPNVMEYMRHWESRAEKAEAELAKIVDGIADDATAIPEACGKLHDLLCLPDDAKPSTAYDWAREAYDLLIPVCGGAIDRAAHAKLILARIDQRKEVGEC